MKMHQHGSTLIKHIFNVKLIPQLDKSSIIVNFSQTLLGKISLVAIFSLGLQLLDITHWIELAVIFFVLSVLPKYRIFLVLCATLYWVFSNESFNLKQINEISVALGVQDLINWTTIQWEILLIIYFFCAVFYLIAFKYKHTLFLKRPITLLIIFYFITIFVACYAPLPELFLTYLWAFIFIFRRFIWFFAYSLLDIHSKKPTPLYYQFGYYQPFWQVHALSYWAYLPIPKGVGYLKKIEVKTEPALAVCQLKAIKLLYWTILLVILHNIMQNVIYGLPGTFQNFFIIPYSLDVPKISSAIYASVAGNPLPWFEGWICVFFNLFDLILITAIYGHFIISCVRMAGYNALRNTYKPLSAKTLVEFWNRFVYYFKELLVEFFFYPAFFRYFKAWPRFRVFFATLCAAGFGNILFHFLYDPWPFFQMGILEAALAFHAYFVYGIILGCGIGISQIRNMNNKGVYPWYRRYITGPLCVFGFFALVRIFDNTSLPTTFSDHLNFALSLLNLQS